MKTKISLLWPAVVCVLTGSVTASPADVPDEALVYSKLPVREVTIFKDGHAFVLHEGSAATDVNGHVVLDKLPTPVMGTFWAYSAQENIKLTCIVSSRDSQSTRVSAGTLIDLLKANPEKQVLIKETTQPQHYQAQIIRLLNEQVVLLKTFEGTKAIPAGQIQNITFLDEINDSITRTVTKETLTFKLDHRGQTPNTSAHIGMGYIQKGLRWIPSYRVELDGTGNAVIRLQAAIVNELADMNDVTVHLVIGVPTFVFKDTTDPISFLETVPQLSSYFTQDSRTGYAFSNAIMTQRSRFTEMPSMVGGGGIEAFPELSEMSGNEDIFVFTLNHITLKKGQRMAVPIVEFTLPYTDIYTVNLPFSPPLEMRRNFNNSQHLQIAKRVLA